MDRRLFFVAPDAISIRVHHDHHTGYWSVRASTSSVTQDGVLAVEQGETYEDLSAQEASDVVAAVLGTLLGL